MPVVDGNKVKIRWCALSNPRGSRTSSSSAEYDITSYVGPGDNINGVMADWQGRIWFVVRQAATVGVLNPPTGAVKTLALEGSITNGFSMDRDAAYIVTTAKMYRVEAGPDGAPHRFGRKGIRTSATKSRAISLPARARRRRFSAAASMLRSPTTPTNCTWWCSGPTPNCRRQGAHDLRGAGLQGGRRGGRNSLIGSGLSLVAYNAFGNDFDKLFGPPQPQKNEPGMARIDIDPNGKGCRRSGRTTVSP